MKLSRPAAVFAAVVLMAAGIGVAVNATETTHAVKLCSNNKTGAVTVPLANGTCAKGTTAFNVGSDADILALANRAARAEDAIDRLNARMGYVEPGEIHVNAYVETNGEPAYDVVGTDLQPGSQIVAHFTHVDYGVQEANLVTVGVSGNGASLFQTGCNVSNVYFTGTAAGGTPVSSVTFLTGPGC